MRIGGTIVVADCISPSRIMVMRAGCMFEMGPDCVKTWFLVGMAGPDQPRGFHARIASINQPTPRMRITRFML